MMKLKTLLMTVIAISVISCSGGKKSGDESSKGITIGYVDGWAEGVAMTEVTKVILEENGYDVKLQKAAVDLIFASLSNGDTDVWRIGDEHRSKLS